MKKFLIYKDKMILPKPKKELFKRILSGSGQFSDYDLIMKK